MLPECHFHPVSSHALVSTSAAAAAVPSCPASTSLSLVSQVSSNANWTLGGGVGSLFIQLDDVVHHCYQVWRASWDAAMRNMPAAPCSYCFKVVFNSF